MKARESIIKISKDFDLNTKSTIAQNHHLLEICSKNVNGKYLVVTHRGGVVNLAKSDDHSKLIEELAYDATIFSCTQLKLEDLNLIRDDFIKKHRVDVASRMIA